MNGLTVDEMIQRVNSEVDQENTTSDSSSDYSLRLTYINRAQTEWAAAYRWKALKKTAFVGVTGTNQASVSLPSDLIGKFGFAGPPALYAPEQEPPYSYNETESEDTRYLLSTDRYVFTLGNDRDGWTAVFNPGTLASGASLAIYYYGYPSSLSSPTNYSIVPDSEFLIKRCIQYVYQSRQDPRFPIVRSEADRHLAQMIEDEVVGSGGRPRRVPNRLFRTGYRPGRD